MPCVWQIYPQDDAAHHAKLEAFLGWLQPPADLREFFLAWNAVNATRLPILDLPAAFSSPQAVALGARVPLHHPALGAVDQVGIPFELSGTPASIRTPPPLLGEQGDEILAELGYSAGEIGDLRAAGVV